MKKLTREEFEQLTKDKQPTALLVDRSILHISKEEALAWFNNANQIWKSPSFVLETHENVWIGANKEDYKEELLRQIGGSN